MSISHAHSSTTDARMTWHAFNTRQHHMVPCKARAKCIHAKLLKCTNCLFTYGACLCYQPRHQLLHASCKLEGGKRPHVSSRPHLFWPWKLCYWQCRSVVCSKLKKKKKTTKRFTVLTHKPFLFKYFTLKSTVRSWP